MNDQQHLSCDIVCLGAGMASTSLVLALISGGYRGRIIMVEQAAASPSDRTWCFWGQQQLPAYLQSLVTKTWSHWRVGMGEQSTCHDASDGTHAYCCIKGEDFYRYASDRLSENPNIQRLFSQPVSAVTTQLKGVQVLTADYCITANLCIDTRPGRPRSSASTSHCAGLMQSFYGLRLTFEQPIIDDTAVGIMDNMHTKDGFYFDYRLPFSQREVLVELTCFARQKKSMAELKPKLLERLEINYPDLMYTVDAVEYGCLPMFTENRGSSGEASIIHAGITAGHIRPATGYAFLPVQRWCQVAAAAILQGNRPPQFDPIPRVYQYLDAIFLRALQDDITIAPALFYRLVEKTTPSQLARFMTEQASITDFLSVIMAMPKRPFIRALLR